jgi:hypothetical protein
VQNAAGQLIPPGGGVVQCGHGQAGFHPRVDGVPDDPVGPSVLDRAQVQLALAGVVFGDVGQPQPVRAGGGELAAYQVVVHRRADPATLAAPSAFTERAPPAVTGADPPRGPVGHRLPGRPGLIDQEPVPELRFIAVGVEQRVGAVCLRVLGLGDRSGQPPVVGLTSDLQYPARHHHGHPVGGQLAHERVEPFPGRFARDRYAVARRRTSFSCSNNLIRLRASRSSTDSLLPTPDVTPASMFA